MRWWIAGGLALLSVLSLFSVSYSAPQESPTLWLAEIRGSINPASSDYIRTALKRAQNHPKSILIIELDTPGGLLASVREMAQAIDESDIPVVVYVYPAGASATSAGALLMFASHLSAMAPGTNIGAAHPVGSKGEEIKGAMGQKIVNDTAAFARSLAELRGRNPQLAEDVVSKSKSFTAKEAQKEKLVELIVDSRETLISQLHGKTVIIHHETVSIQTKGVPVQKIEMSWGQKLLHLLANPNIATILMTLAMLLIYVEVSNPGITIAGVLGGICLLIAFMAFQVLPIQTGGAALLALGIVLMIAEAFAATGGILGGGGVLAFVLGLLWLFDPEKTDLRVSGWLLGAAAITLSSAMIVLGVSAARMKTLSALTLKKMGGAGQGGLEGYEGEVFSLGKDHHSGKVKIRGELWDFHSNEALKKGDGVRVVSVSGLHVQIKKK